MQRCLVIARALSALTFTAFLASTSCAAFAQAGGVADAPSALPLKAQVRIDVSSRHVRSARRRAETYKWTGSKTIEKPVTNPAVREAEEAYQRETERETQRRLDEIILKQLLRDAGSRK